MLEIGAVLIGKLNAMLFVVGTFLMCINAFATWGQHFTFLAIFVAGFVLLVAGSIRSMASGPFSVIWLLGASNLSFWGSYGIWVSLHTILLGYWAGKFPEEGAVAEIAGTMALWLLFLLIFIIYELTILLRNIISNRQRTLCFILLIPSLAQIPLTMRFAWNAVQGA
jgi:hypothetical protein